jgi:hypothetical protein
LFGLRIDRPTTVSNHVALEKSRFDVSPLGERAYRNLVLEQSPWFVRAQYVRLTQRAQQPVHRGWTELQLLCTDLIRDDQVAVALEGGDELR